MSETAPAPRTRRGLRSLVVLVVIGALVGLVAGLVVRPVYTAVVRAFVSTAGSSATLLAEQGPSTQQVAQSFAGVATTPIVLRPVIAELGLGVSPADLAKRIDAHVPSDTALLEIAVTDASPTRAADIANAVGRQLVATASRIMPVPVHGTGTDRVRVVQTATAPSSPSSPVLPLDVALGALTGAGVRLLVAAIRVLVAAARRGSSGGTAAPSMF